MLDQQIVSRQFASRYRVLNTQSFQKIPAHVLTKALFSALSGCLGAQDEGKTFRSFFFPETEMARSRNLHFSLPFHPQNHVKWVVFRAEDWAAHLSGAVPAVHLWHCFLQNKIMTYRDLTHPCLVKTLGVLVDERGRANDAVIAATVDHVNEALSRPVDYEREGRLRVSPRANLLQ